MGEFIHLASGTDRIHSYLARPKTPNGCGIVLGAAVWGLNFDLVGFAECYADLGYTVLAPNLFWRLQPEHAIDYDFTRMPFAHSLAESGSNQEGLDDLRLACAELKRMADCRRVAVVGWCYGGRLACLAATEKTFNASVAMYPTYLEKHLDIADRIQCPMNLHFPELERYGTVENVVEHMVGAFAGNPLVESFVYPGVEHGFDFAPPHPYSNHAASRLCDSRVIRFLDRVLLRQEAAAA